MIFTNLPSFDYNLRIIEDKYYIFDIIRRKYVRLTPEEWTRQHLIHHLTKDLSYSKALISVERKIQGHYRSNRPDLVIYDKNGKPFLIAECKASHIAITDKAYSQLARYNRQLKAPLLVISNGKEYGCWEINFEGAPPKLLDSIPDFSNQR